MRVRFLLHWRTFRPGDIGLSEFLGRPVARVLVQRGIAELIDEAEPAAKRRGRPKGSKNKPKV